MGESDRFHRNEFKQRRKSRFTLGADGNALTALFALNVVFFLILMVLQVGFYVGEKTPDFFYTTVVQWFELPSSLTKLSERPWTLFTYVFTESGAGIIRGITNMIWLWGFGYILQQMAGNDKIIPVYIYGGFTGAIFFIAAHYFIPPIAMYKGVNGIMGANAGVMAVAMATTAIDPNFRFFTQIRNGIPIWVLMTAYILIDFAGVASTSAAYSLAHLGGALAGFLFVVFLRRGKDGSVWMNKAYFKFITLFEPKPGSNTNPKDAFFYKTGDRKPFTKTTSVTQQRVDEILDKINQKGYHFLTDEEKAFLKKAADDEAL
ncbi:rhomboid family intramembrane serine protease [Ferruginibacter yonginensis]|uniref:Rhomboid family intramembrane serine protease n=1 Tax=Ferruginibacter yonginensis TaxID=1310416 RepID=A0ABV8QTX9_9BACT